MSKLQKLSVFRIFSANQWSQSEQIVLSNQISLIVSNLPIFFSNAEKLRKIVSIQTHIDLSELFRTHQSNGLRILFPLIQKCFNFFTLVQVA